ncbi:MAG: hypothetical protein WCL50_12565 [Spirochaetota bacterium]
MGASKELIHPKTPQALPPTRSVSDPPVKSEKALLAKSTRLSLSTTHIITGLES